MSFSLSSQTLPANPFQNAPLLDCPPADPLRRAAESIAFSANLTPSQLAWARSHDWCDEVLPDGTLIVTDRFTYKGHSYEERFMWGGTFAELRLWAGY